MGRAADLVNKKIEAFNAHDAKQIMAILSPDVEWAIPGGLLRGPDQVIEFFSGLWEAFPDFALTVTYVAGEGSTVITQARAQGTHQGTFHTPDGDIPSTGRRVDLPLSETYEVTGGVIVSVRLLFDRLELLEQLGVAPAPASA